MDLRVTYLREVLPVTKMVDVPGPPHQLFLLGPEVSRVVDVEINGVRGYKFTVSGPRAIVVDLPPLFTFRTVAVLGREMGKLLDAVIHIGFTTTDTEVEGLSKLVQDYVKCFFSTPGVDVFSKSWGGGGNQLVNAAYAKDGDIATACTAVVQRTNKLIFQRQLGNLSIPRSERLEKADIVRSQRSLDGQEWQLDIEIMNAEGRRVRAGIA